VGDIRQTSRDQALQMFLIKLQKKLKKQTSSLIISKNYNSEEVANSNAS